MPKILLVGAGNIGAVIARDLILTGNKDVTVIDADGSRLSALKKEHKGLVETLKLDVSKEKALARVMKDAAVTVNAASYRFNLHVLRAAIEARCNVVDLGGLYHMTMEELRYGGRARKAGITAIIGMGDDPGTSNVMARMASWDLDTVSDIRIRWGSFSPNTENISFGFAVATCLDEATMSAVKFAKGRRREVPPLSEAEEVTFPEPIGKQMTYAILHSEVATLPKFIKGVENVSYKDSWDDATISVVKFLKASGLASDREVAVRGQRVSPRKLLLTLLSPNESENAVGCLIVKVSGRKAGRPATVTYCLGPVGYGRKYLAPVTAYTTAMPASIVTQMVAEGMIDQTGVLPPEELRRDQVKHFLSEMRARGLDVRRLVHAG